MNNGLTIVVSAPSGGGKGTILKELMQQCENLRLSVSATTRSPRPGEIHGEQYYFITKDEFSSMIAEGKMLEYAQYCDNFYGTPSEPVKEMTANGLDVILEIEVQGGDQVKKIIPDCVSVFITPPSMEVLENRLRSRGTEDDATIAKRLETARKEIPHASDYDYVVINDKLEDAVADLKAIIKAEKLKYKNNHSEKIFSEI